MNSELTFRIIFLALWTVFLTISYARHPQQLGSRLIRERLKGSSKWESKPNVALRVVLFFFWFAALIFYAIYPYWMTDYTLPLPIWIRWIGVGAAVVSLPLLAWAHHTLGEQFSPNLRLMEKHTLVTSGPYRWMRHPMYAAESVFMIALAAESANWLVAPPMVAGIVLLYARVRKEEAMLIERFGDEYRGYMKHTGRFLPRFKHLNSAR